MKTERIRDRFMPWAGLALGTVGFFTAHQVGSDATFQDCRLGSPAIVFVGTIIGILWWCSAHSARGGSIAHRAKRLRDAWSRSYR